MAQPFLYNADTISQKLWRRLLLLSGNGIAPPGPTGPRGTLFGARYFPSPMFGPRYYGTIGHAVTGGGSYFGHGFYPLHWFGQRMFG